MTTSTLPARYKINGLLDTKDPVFDNIEKICNACGTFMSYDIHEGKWSVIINKADTAVMTFDDSNIVGPIQVNGTSILNLYNSVRVEFPLRDTADGTDFVTVEIPTADRYQNEPDNVLQLRLDMCNEPVQAEIIGLIELKQARIDQIITFQTDYSTLNLNAGDIIAVTNDLYQFSSKGFRVITLKEIDADDGSIRIEITALAYDSNVYDTSDLGRYIRSDRNGIKGIGAIGQPNDPTLTVYQQDVRPGIQVEAVVPSGIVERMELWLSSDNSNYVQIGTQYPTGGTSFNPGDTVLFDYDQLDSQNIYVKVRGMNSTTTGPFSDSVSFLSYVPVQTTSAITQDTALIGDSGNLPLALGLATLINKLTSLFGSGDASNSLADQLISQGGLDSTSVDEIDYGNSNTQSKIDAQLVGYSTTTGYNVSNILANQISIPLTLSSDVKLLDLTVITPTGLLEYDYWDAATGAPAVGVIVAQVPMEIYIYQGATQIGYATVDWIVNNTRFVFKDLSAGSYTIKANMVQTYALNQNWPQSGTNSRPTVSPNIIYVYQVDLNTTGTFKVTASITL